MITRGRSASGQPPKGSSKYKGAQYADDAVYEYYSTTRAPRKNSVEKKDTPKEKKVKYDSAPDGDCPVIAGPVGADVPRRSRTGRFEKNIETSSLKSSWSDATTAAELSASSGEVFLPASSFENNPHGQGLPAKQKRARGRKQPDPPPATAGTAANPLASEQLVSDEIVIVGPEESEDLGPPLPPPLTIETSFKRKKGYHYDTDTSLRTPSKETEKPIKFKSCLLEFDDRSSPLLDSASKMSRTFVLQRALSIEELNDESWLSSSLIDLVFSRFARCYHSVDFLPVDFAVMLSLPSSSTSELFNATDILGRKLRYDSKRPMLLLYNAKNIHWILIKIQLDPQPQLQLFEPMGQPINPKRGMSYRIVPRDVVRWLDICCPLPDKSSWLSKAISAITSQQQFTSFDCGVACLLYAEKCGQGEVKCCTVAAIESSIVLTASYPFVFCAELYRDR